MAGAARRRSPYSLRVTDQRADSASRLRRVEAINVRVPFRRPFLDVTGEFTHRPVWLLRTVDADGFEGLGEAALHPAASDASTAGLAALMRAMVPALIDGRPPSEADLLAEGEPGRAALAALDGALGALAASRGEAASGRAGGAGSAISVVASIGFGGPDAGGESAAQAVELGFETLRLRAGHERHTDHLVDRVRAVRAAIGPGPRLRIEVGGAWDLETATERIVAIERFGIEFVEQPLANWDLAGHAALRERVGVRIALDDSVDSEGGASAAIAERAADVLVLRPARLGGSGPTLRIAHRAADAGVDVVLGAFFETGVGIAAALRIAARLGQGGPAHGLATGGVLVHDLLAHPLPIERGTMAAPAAVTLDEDEVSRRAVERVVGERQGD